MRPKALSSFLAQCLRIQEQILVVGPPGMGKTDIWHQATRSAGYDLILTHPAVADPTDYKGFPARAEDGTHATFLPFGELWRALNATNPTLILVDDLGQATDSVQKALMQLLWGRRLNGHILPANVVFGGATNDVKQMAGVTGLLETIKSRFTSIINLEGHPDDWADWALDHGLPTHLVAFMRSPEAVLPSGEHLLYAWKPTKELKNGPCPRTWAHLGRMQQQGVRDLEVWSGTVGEPAATQYWRWLEVAEKAPDIDAILADPANAPIPDKPSLLYLVATAMGRIATQSNYDRVSTYLGRLDQPFRFLAHQDLGRRENEALRSGKLALGDAVKTHPTYQRWLLGEGKAITSGMPC